MLHRAAIWRDQGLSELARFLQVKELSTASHAVRPAEERLKEDSGFRRQAVSEVAKFLRRDQAHISMMLLRASAPERN